VSVHKCWNVRLKYSDGKRDFLEYFDNKISISWQLILKHSSLRRLVFVTQSRPCNPEIKTRSRNSNLMALADITSIQTNNIHWQLTWMGPEKNLTVKILFKQHRVAELIKLKFLKPVHRLVRKKLKRNKTNNRSLLHNRKNDRSNITHDSIMNYSHTKTKCTFIKTKNKMDKWYMNQNMKPIN